jgi:hypothetical protein
MLHCIMKLECCHVFVNLVTVYRSDDKRGAWPLTAGAVL